MEPFVIVTALSAKWIPPGYTPLLFIGLLLASIGTVLLFCVGLVSYIRRRSTRYLLLTVALGALVVRTVVGWGTAVGGVPMITHHLIEHGLDFFIAVVILYLVYQR